MKKRVLVVSKGWIHPSIACRLQLRYLFAQYDDCITFSYTNSLDGMKELKGSEYDGVVLYYHEKRIKKEVLNVLLQFVEKGAGVLVLHSAMASFKENAAYRKLLGGRFIGHGKIGRIEVYTKNATKNGGIGPMRFLLKDELYIHQYDKTNDIVLVCDNEDQQEPVLWTKNYGMGRVCYFSAGHCSATFRSMEVATVLKKALLWICRSEE